MILRERAFGFIKAVINKCKAAEDKQRACSCARSQTQITNGASHDSGISVYYLAILEYRRNL
jgi:hypothetical protein